MNHDIEMVGRKGLQKLIRNKTQLVLPIQTKLIWHRFQKYLIILLQHIYPSFILPVWVSTVGHGWTITLHRMCIKGQAVDKPSVLVRVRMINLLKIHQWVFFYYKNYINNLVIGTAISYALFLDCCPCNCRLSLESRFQVPWHTLL